MAEIAIDWTDYMRYRATTRYFDLARIEEIVRYSNERYVDTNTGRLIVVGRHDTKLVLVPYEQEGSVMRPITIHTISRQQILSRIKSGRLLHE